MMDTQRQLQEDLLHAWIEMSLRIRGNRILSNFSFNEIMICGLLYRRQLSGHSPYTATELGTHTQLLKSQINHILTGMENRGLIRRERSTADKRVIYVRLQEDAVPQYLAEHEKVLEIVRDVCKTLGDDNTHTLTTLMRAATTVVNDHLPKEEI